MTSRPCTATSTSSPRPWAEPPTGFASGTFPHSLRDVKRSGPERRSESVRIAARAVIIRDGRLLTVRVRTDEGEFLVLPGGGQEHGRRAGTQNLIGAAGFGAAVEAALASPRPGPGARDAAAAAVAAAGALVVGAAAPRLDDVLCIATPDLPSEIQVMGLDLAGVQVSAGAACSSGKVRPSRVLEAMGLGDLAGCAIRLSGGWSTRSEDWRIAVETWIDLKTRRQSRRHPAAA